jgi:hypothetical protein
VPQADFVTFKGAPGLSLTLKSISPGVFGREIATLPLPPVKPARLPVRHSI